MATYWSDMHRNPTCVYRAYIGDRLAYVGMTRNPRGRYSKHGSLKPWWKSVTRIEETWFDDRTAAKSAEHWAIHDGNPMFNIVRPEVSYG